VFLAGFFSCSSSDSQNNGNTGYSHSDQPFEQEYSIKYHVKEALNLKKIRTDRNGATQILATEGLYKPDAGHFLYPGTLVPDKTYLPMGDKNISGLGEYQNQLVYLDNQ